VPSSAILLAPSVGIGSGDLLDVKEAIETRRSVRAYHPDPVPEDVLRRILEAGRLAPSAVNRQPWHFVVVREQKMRTELSKTAIFGRFIKEAPVAVVACGDTKASPTWYVVDVAIALEQMVLMATAEGIGTCWIGSMNKDQVRKLLSIPERWDVVAIITMGYPREKISLGSWLVRSEKRKGISEIVSGEVFGGAITLPP
jgi:nitroreductase